MKVRKTYSTKCRGCGKIVRVKAPSGDWLGALYPIRHKNNEGKDCDWWTCEVKDKDLIEPTKGQTPK